MPNLLCMVATPTRELFSGEIAYADVPGSEGNYGVLSGHEMLVAKNSPGVLTLSGWMPPATRSAVSPCYEGATQVYADRLTVLARFGVDVDNIDAEAVRKKADGMRERVAELEAKHAGHPEVESYGAILETSPGAPCLVRDPAARGGRRSCQIARRRIIRVPTEEGEQPSCPPPRMFGSALGYLSPYASSGFAASMASRSSSRELMPIFL